MLIKKLYDDFINDLFNDKRPFFENICDLQDKHLNIFLYEYIKNVSFWHLINSRFPLISDEFTVNIVAKILKKYPDDIQYIKKNNCSNLLFISRR